MSTIEEVNQELSDVSASLVLANQKADAVIAFIHTLQAGVPVTQEQLDAVAASLAAIKAQEDTVNAKLDAAVA